MRRTISSLQTSFLKFVFPPLWIGGFTIATIALFLGAGDFRDAAGNTPPLDLKWVFLLVTIAGGSFIYWACAPLKRVELDDRALYISNYSKEIEVPLRDIAEVTENRWIHSHPVTIHFHRETEFGDSIVFMPTVRWFGFWSSHPIVAELRAAAARARGAA
ncbi:MAG TPA: hypothetical protein VGQ18_10310 [Gemmatimonadales bacterium]|jgi:hypothetical protein|nr:hypothetical protein [Gemmatimonadales bacterium]